MRRILALLVSLPILAACGSGGPPASPATSEDASASPTVTASPGPTGGSAGMPGCPNFVEVVETGPIFGGEDQGEFGPLAQAQARLHDDVEAAQAYGAAHPGEFASLRFENGPRVRIVIGFTARIAEHCAALRDLLTFKDEFEIIEQATTEADLLRIQQEIVDIAMPFLVSTGSGGADGVIDVALRADGESMADELVARYGNLAEIRVGLLSFPDKQLPEGGGCDLPVDQILDDSPLRATLQLEPDPVHPGADFQGSVRVTNVGLTTFDFQTGASMPAFVFRPGEPDVIGRYVGGFDALGAGAVLDPLDFLDLRVVGGTASCDPALGYALPPGEYEARALVDQYTMHDHAPTEVGYIVSDAVPFTIVP